MTEAVYDAIVVGGGMIGLAMAHRLSSGGLSVALVEGKTPVLAWGEDVLDPRVSSINWRVQTLLERWGIWQHLSPHAMSRLDAIEVVDAMTDKMLHFHARDAKLPVLGAIVENRELVRVLWNQLIEAPNVALYTPLHPEHMAMGERDIGISLSDGQKLRAPLLIGADGVHSWVRSQMQTTTLEKPGHPHALIAVIETEESHEKTARQVFLSEGPLALLPLANEKYVDMVWSGPHDRIEELAAMDVEEFECELNNAFGMKLGFLRCKTERFNRPLILNHVKEYVKPRMVLIGDAAHTIHPLAGQGANLGFFDVACLSNILLEARRLGHDLGGIKGLRQYERTRKGDNWSMDLLMRGLDSVFGSDSLPVVKLRGLGFSMLDHTTLFKKFCIAYATGRYAST